MAYAEDIPEQIDDDDEAQPVDPVAFVEEVTQARNLASVLSDDVLDEIGRDVVEDYETDFESMSDWRNRAEDSIKAANLEKPETKDYPYKNAANISFPLLTTAVLEFHAKAFPVIVPSGEIVKTKVWGRDPQGAKAARGQRVAEYMTWQLKVEMRDWERQIDMMLLQLPVVNDVFRKVWHDGERCRTKILRHDKFAVNAEAESLDQVPRFSDVLEYFPHEIQDKENADWFVEIDYPPEDDDDAPQEFIEQHRRIDLDEDGYREPYVVTVHKASRRVVRLVADFTPDDVEFEFQEVMQMIPGPPMFDAATGMVMPTSQQQMVREPIGIRKIASQNYFVHYQFLPSFDGKLLGRGLGALLADVGATVNTTFNMLLDAGKFEALGGGFIGSEFRIRGGNHRMAPGEFRTVQARGDDIRKAVVERTFPGPSQVLFNLLGLVIDTAKDVAGTRDALTPEAAHNMPATTAMALTEQGARLFKAIYRRVYWGLAGEFSRIAAHNRDYVSPEKYAQFLDEQADPRADFDSSDMDITPVADADAVLKSQQMAKAQLIMDAAQNGMANPSAAMARVFEAAGIDNVEELLPPPPDPMQQQLAMQNMQMDFALKQLTIQRAEAEVAKVAGEIDKMRAGIMETLSGIERDNFEAQLAAVEVFISRQRQAIDQALQIAQAVQGQQ